MHFGENELSLGSIGFSPLYLPHPPAFQRRWVRTSTVSYHSFILDRHRSPSFASTSRYSRPIKTRFPFGSISLTLQLKVTRRIILQKARHHQTSWLWPLVSTRFQFLFHSPNRGSFHLSLTVLFTIGQQEYLALRDMVHADSHKISRVPCYSGSTNFYLINYLYRTFTFYGLTFQIVLIFY